MDGFAELRTEGRIALGHGLMVDRVGSGSAGTWNVSKA